MAGLWRGSVLFGGVVCVLSAALVQAAPPAGDSGEVIFVRDVLPLLQARCVSCHGRDPADVAGGLDLTSPTTAFRGGDSGLPLWDPAHPANSRILQAVRWQDPDLRMPPKESDRLSDAEWRSIQRWLELGAEWPSEARMTELRQTSAHLLDRGQRVPTSGGLSADWDQRSYEPAALWAYRPLRSPPHPQPGSSATVIDQWIETGLAQRELTAAPRADRATLIRRATYDLHGLPPTPDEVSVFVADPRDDKAAFAALVDRLLASPHYGEQMAAHWLDVVRYADSAGLANDFARPNAWRYRDWVVRAFQADLPYGEFIRRQVAGDELHPSDAEHLIAVGFLRMGPWEQTAMSVAKLTRQQFLDDVTDIVGQVFLAQPLQCCRCHDHKYDPLPTRDYYRFQAIFATTQFADRDAPFLPAESRAGFADPQRLLEERIARYEELQRQLQEKSQAAERAWYAERGKPYRARHEALAQGVPESELPPRHLGLGPADFGLERIAHKNLVRHRWERDQFAPLAFSVYSGGALTRQHVESRLPLPAADVLAQPVEATRVLAGGDPFRPGETVSPAVLSCLEGLGEPAHPIPATPSGRRLALANWLARPNHPLAARVIVNRIWQIHFGHGLAANPNNFGATGARPTHPELLDWLACQLEVHHGSLQALHRLIMNTDVYCRSIHHTDPADLRERDPAGTSYAVAVPRRLAAEALRDGLLAVSNELNRQLGGLPVRPEIDRETALQPRQIMGTFAPAYQPSPQPSDRHRRALYALRLRGLNDPLLEVFNQPSSERSCERRETATIAPQALTLLNGPWISDRAAACARDLLSETPELESAIALLYRRCFARPATAAELSLSLAYVQRQLERHRRVDVARRAAWPVVLEREAVEEMSGEPFRFVEELETNREFVPDLQFADLTPEARSLAELCLVLFNSNEFLYID